MLSGLKNRCKNYETLLLEFKGNLKLSWIDKLLFACLCLQVMNLREERGKWSLLQCLTPFQSSRDHQHAFQYFRTQSPVWCFSELEIWSLLHFKRLDSHPFALLRNGLINAATPCIFSVWYFWRVLEHLEVHVISPVADHHSSVNFAIFTQFKSAPRSVKFSKQADYTVANIQIPDNVSWEVAVRECQLLYIECEMLEKDKLKKFN